MGTKTKIEWADSTINPTPCCVGCELYPTHCYAAGLHRRYDGHNPGWPKSFTAPTYYGGRIAEACQWRDLTGKPRPNKPWLDGMPRVVFVDDCGDPFAPFEAKQWQPKTHWLHGERHLMATSPHIWILLTKWPERMAEFTNWHGPFPENVWAGTSITDQRTADLRLPDLRRVSASTRIISYEPALGPVDLEPILPIWSCYGCGYRGNYRDTIDDKGVACCPHCTTHDGDGFGMAQNDPAIPSIHGVLVGGETGTDARPMHPDNVRSVRDQCIAAGVNFFFKSLGEWIHDSQADTSWPLKNAVAKLARCVPGHRCQCRWPDGSFSYRVGKPLAGRLLDGRKWDELPGTKGGVA